MDRLRLDTSKSITKTYRAGDQEVSCLVYEDVVYCEFPKDPIQKLNIYIPAEYLENGTVQGYTKDSAPIFIPNTAGGYMPGPSDEPGMNRRRDVPNAIFEALLHGYVVVSGGVRGRTSGKVSDEFYEGGSESYLGTEGEKPVGRAPAFIVDMKAIVRYIRHNRDLLCGDTERIITSGTSAGGALSALAGATGNEEDYLPYLKEIGAAKERDDVYGANCYCPIHNLEHADAAYEWQFVHEWDYHKTVKKKTEQGLVRIPLNGELTEEQKQLSRDLCDSFPSYVNGLQLRDSQGQILTLEEDGTGSFRTYIEQTLTRAAQKERDTHTYADTCQDLVAPNSAPEQVTALEWDGDKVTGVNWDEYQKNITRMKATPAFDDLSLSSPENEEFGDEATDARHFTAFAVEHSKVQGEMAPEHLIRMMNPLSYISEDMDTKHFRIRHGSFDRDTSLAIPTILALSLKNAGCSVDFELPWGLPHAGDYDLEELFHWIDDICS